MNVVPGTSAATFPPPPDPNVVVWEWQDEFGRWRPYLSGVCSYIEQSFQTLTAKGRRSLGAMPVNSSIPLGHADAALSPYVIDIPSLTQFRQDTGTMRTVRRLIFPLNSAAGQGVIWEWQNDEAGWFPYEMSVCIYLEKALSCHSPQADLGHLGYNYQIDFVSNAQTNKTTGYQRRVRRRVDSPYPMAVASGPSHAGPTCSCQQCLLNKRTGPITSRYRHSMGNLPGPSAGTIPRPFPGAQGANGMPGLGSSFVGFVPYSKPAPAGARSVPWLNIQSLGATLQSTTISGASSSHGAAGGASVPKLPVSMSQPGRVTQALADMMAFLMSVPGFPVQLARAPPPGRPRRASKKPRRSVKMGKRVPIEVGTRCPEEMVKQYLEELRAPPADEDCIICMEKLNVPSGYADACESKTIRPESVGRLSQCHHTFHLLCVLAMYTSGNKDGSLQCPSCKTIYGEKTGTQPDGKMDISMLPDTLPGHEGCGSIQITYYINKGIQGPGHPNPGQPYTARGFPRYCYLPNNEKGRKVLELLQVAWRRRLIFTVGTSSTTGENNTVVWNEIHHKTEMTSNLSGHGFPDPNYLDNVLAELAVQGVTEGCLRA